MKKNNLYLVAIILAGYTANAQGVGIGTNTPATSSILELSATNKGFLMPRMSTGNRTSIANPATGLQVFDTTTNTIWYQNGTTWINSGASSADDLGDHSATQALILNDNELKLRGTTDSNNKLVYNSAVNGPSLTGSAGGSLSTFDGTTATTALTWKSAGNVGIGTTTPFADAMLQVAKDKENYGEFGQLMVTGLSRPNQKLVLGYNTTADKGFIQSVNSGSNWSNLILQPNNGNVAIGTFTDVAATSKLEVNGASTNHVAYDAGAGRAINFALSNLAYTTATAGAFTLNNMKDGGTYTLSVRGATAGTSTFTATGFTVKYANNRATIVNTESIYTFIVMGTTVYVYTATGF